MPKKPSGNFNQAEYQASWDKQNMAYVNCKFKKDFVMEFKQACAALGITQSDAVRRAMQETIDEAKKAGQQ